MLFLITGMPGNGKSLRAMALALEEHDRNAAAVKAGKEKPRRFFTNIAGATREENPDAFEWFERMPDHNDWTQLPEGSFVVYDEAHSDGKTPGLERYGELFPSTGKPGESMDPRIRAMSTHRHKGYDIAFVTQWPSKIHHQVRSLVGKHLHMTRAMGLGAAGVLTWTRVQPDPYDERQREKAEEEVWTYPKDLYKRYKSSTLHTSAHKFRLPKKIKNGLITGLTLVLMFALFWWWMGWDFSVFTGGGGQPQAKASVASPAAVPLWSKSSDSTVVTVPQGTGAYTVLNTEPAPSLMGCVSSDRGCRCFNVEGYVIDMSQHQCEDILSRPLPFNVAHRYASPSRDDPRDLEERGGRSSPVPGYSGGEVGSAPAPAVDASFGKVTRSSP